MQRRLKPLFLRGIFAATLSVAAIAGAATQAASFEGEVRFERGRLVLVDAREVATQCLRLAWHEATVLNPVEFRGVR